MLQAKKLRSTTKLWRKSECMIAYPSKYISFEKAQRFNNFYNWLYVEDLKANGQKIEKRQTAEQVLRQFRRVVEQQNRITKKKQKALEIDQKMMRYSNLPPKIRSSIRASLVQQQQKRQIRKRQRLKAARKTGSLPNLHSISKKTVSKFELSSARKGSQAHNPQNYFNISNLRKGSQEINLYHDSNRIRDIADSQFKRSYTEDLQKFIKNTNSTRHQTLKLSKVMENLQSLNYKSGQISKFQTPNLLTKKSLFEQNEILEQKQSNFKSVQSVTMYNSMGSQSKTKKVQFKFNIKRPKNNFQGIQEGQSEKMQKDEYQQMF